MVPNADEKSVRAEHELGKTSGPAGVTRSVRVFRRLLSPPKGTQGGMAHARKQTIEGWARGRHGRWDCPTGSRRQRRDRPRLVPGDRPGFQYSGKGPAPRPEPAKPVGHVIKLDQPDLGVGQ